MNNRIITGTMLQQDDQNLVAKIKSYTQSEITGKLLYSEMSDAILDSVNTNLVSQKQSRITAVLANKRYH